MADESLATFFMLTEPGRRARIVCIGYQSGDENLDNDGIRELEELVQQQCSPSATVKYLTVAEHVEWHRNIQRKN